MITVAVTLSLTGCGGTKQQAAAPSPTPDLLAVAQTACDQAQTGTRIEDAGKTLVIDGAGKQDFTGVDQTGLQCLLSQLTTPAAVTERMYATRALDGRQEGTWGAFSASWTYHPDQGLDIIVTTT